MNTDRLETWKEIAKYFLKSKRTTERLAADRALPIHREPGGTKPRVFAYKRELDEWRRGNPQYCGEESEVDLRLPTPVGLIERQFLFAYPGGHADAIRLYGEGDAYVSPQHLSLRYKPKRYDPPTELRKRAEEQIALTQKDAKEHNRVFFNGPNVRLIRWHRNQQGDTERDTLELTLGPVGWFDLVGINGPFREGRQREATSGPHAYVDLQSLLAQDGDIDKSSKLSNIMGNAVTIFTCDGKVGYQVRGDRQSAVPRLVTSAVAENVNRYLDDTDPNSPRKLLHPENHRMKAHKRPDNTYRAKRPDIIATVRRGIKEEVSPFMLKHLQRSGIKLTGLAFGLDSLHPDALWIVLVDVSAERFKKIRSEHPGKDAHEGRIEFVPASFGSSATQHVLAREDWVAAGKASLIRAIELISAIRPDGDPIEVFDILTLTP